MSRRPFSLSIITRQISRRYQEEDDDDYEGGTEGDGAEATDRAVGVTGAGRGNDYGGDERGLFGRASIVRHFLGWCEAVRV